MPGLSKVQMHAIMKGRVQGVGFRAYTAFLAREMDLIGTVRNLPDNTVEIYAQGTRNQLELLIEKLQNEFSLDPKTSIEVTFSEVIKPFETFSILR